MEFVTIHDLSRELNVPARVVRYRLLNLIQNGKLKEHEDFRRDDFKDDLHFVWKVHPLRFRQESGLKAVANISEFDNHFDNQTGAIGSKVDNSRAAIETELPKLVINDVTKVDDLVSKIGNRVEEFVTKTTGENPLSREMIDLLKEQIRFKDGQLKEQGLQLQQSHELNLKLNGAILSQAAKIENLLRLTADVPETPETAAQDGAPAAN